MLGFILIGCLFSILHNSDAGVDDFVSTALLEAAIANKRDVAFDAVIITNGDCEPYSALSAYQKMAKLLNASFEVSLSHSRVWTPFPWIWRTDSFGVEGLPCLQAFQPDPYALNGNVSLHHHLHKSKKIKILATGPLTTLADVLRESPALSQNIMELHWMGGAMQTDGNLLGSPEISEKLLNNYAEWNAFADPTAVDWIFKNTSFPIYLYPLDLSNSAYPSDFLSILHDKPNNLYIQFVKECYELVKMVEGYRMWDAAAAVGLLDKEAFNPPVVHTLRIETSGRLEGALIKDPKGRQVNVFMEFKNDDPQIFYEKAASILSFERE